MHLAALHGLQIAGKRSPLPIARRFRLLCNLIQFRDRLQQVGAVVGGNEPLKQFDGLGVPGLGAE
jgi:hypothetical protein